MFSSVYKCNEVELQPIKSHIRKYFQGSRNWILYVNKLRLRENGRLFPDNILKWIFLKGNEWISIKI